MRIKYIFIIFILQYYKIAIAQEKIAIATSIYSPVNSIFLNPATSVDSKAFAQLNLAMANVYFLNNQVFLPKFSLSAAIKGKINDPQLITSKQKKFFYTNLSIDGPAFILSNKEIGIGFFTRARGIVDIRNVPYQITSILLNQDLPTTIPNKYSLNLRNVKISAMAWAEYGVNFGKMIRKKRDVIISAAGNLRFLTGIGLEYFNLEKLKINADSKLLDIELKGKSRFSNPSWNAGKGVGLDIGITYQKMKEGIDNYYANSRKSDCITPNYKYKVGASLIDFGAMRFTKQTIKASIDSKLQITNYSKANSINDIFNSNLSVSNSTNPVIAVLPTAISAQLDYNFGHHINIAGTLMQNIVLARVTGVQRLSFLCISPRWATKNIEIATPVTLQKYKYLQLGIMFRFRSFVLGIENALPLFIKTNLKGANIYIGIGATMFKNPSCREIKLRKKKMKNYNWNIKHLKEKFKLKPKADTPKENDFLIEKKTEIPPIVDCPKIEDETKTKNQNKKDFFKFFRKKQKNESEKEIIIK